MKKSRIPTSASTVLTVLTMPLAFAVLFRLLIELRAAMPLTQARAAAFLGMLEFPVAAAMLIMGGILLCEYMERRQK